MPGMHNWSILVVEDEPDGQMVIAGILNYFNVTVEAVTTAEEALQTLRKTTYNAVVIDLALPGMDGLQLIKEVRANTQTAGLPCVAVTAYHTSAVKLKAIDAGFDAYFSKPIDDTSFVRELSRLIDAK